MKSSALPRLILALVLLLAQAGIVAVGLFAPRVSEEYRAFFITHTSSEWRGQP